MTKIPVRDAAEEEAKKRIEEEDAEDAPYRKKITK